MKLSEYKHHKIDQLEYQFIQDLNQLIDEFFFSKLILIQLISKQEA